MMGILTQMIPVDLSSMSAMVMSLKDVNSFWWPGNSRNKTWAGGRSYGYCHP